MSLAAQAQTTVVSRQPARHAVAATRTTSVVVGFSQPVSASSASALRVYGSQLRGKRPGTISGGGTSSLTFAPAQAFAPGEVVSVSLPSTLTSTTGGSISRHVFQFTAATGGTGKGFFLDTTIVGNTANRDQVLGDLDNDGDLDLVTTGALYGCRVFLNNGAGKYSFKTGFAAAEVPGGVTLADVDQDGDQDILVGDSENNTVSVCLNDGTGEFTSSVTGAQNAPVGARPVGVATGDIDGDGDQDFVTANASGNSSTVYFNGGPYTAIGLYYYSPTTVAMGAGPTAVALADIDNDGDLDLVTTNAGTDTNPLGEVHVSRNSGTGAFGAYTSVAVGLQPTELVMADVDGDGDLDLLTANTGGASVSVRLNNGNGSFSGTTTLPLPMGSTPSGLRCGDVDGDDDLDLVVAQGSGGRVFTYLNTSGIFTLQTRSLRLGNTAFFPAVAEGVTLGDVDGDLDLDLITSNSQGQVILSLNVGSPPPLPTPVITSLTPASGPVGTSITILGSALTSVTVVHFNGTPAPGFELSGTGTSLRVSVPATASSGVVTVSTEEAGTATSPMPFTVTIPVPVLLTAVTPPRNKVSIDVGSSITATFSVPIAAATVDQMRVFGNQRQGRRQGGLTGADTKSLTFDPAQDFAPGEQVSVSFPATLLASDGNKVTPQVVQFTAAVGGTGRHDFLTASSLSLTATNEYQLADLDTDGDLDLAVPTGSQGVKLQMNNGAGTFSGGSSLTNAAAADMLTLGDVDADGDVDIISASNSGTGVVWLNNGRGSFTNAASLAAGTYGGQLVLADVDADGDLDLLASMGSALSTFVNDGKGQFSARQDQYPGLTLVDMAVGDVDADGDLDVVAPGRSTSTGQNTVLVLLNNGVGTFSSPQGFALASPAAVQAALADLDGDGDLDLALKGSVNYQEHIFIHVNDGRGRFASASTSFPLAGLGMTIADADADGDLDIITYSGIGLNNGAGAFPNIVKTTDAGSNPAQVAVGDVDGDLDLDLLTNDLLNTVRVKLNRPGPPPVLTSLMPGSGPAGSNILLTGLHLGTATQITFNGLAATAFTVIGPHQLTVTVPAGATSGPVVVVTPAGSAAVPFEVTSSLGLAVLNPARNAHNVPASTAISLTFAQPVTSDAASKVQVFSTWRGGRLPGAVTGGGTRTLTFTPAQPYAAGETVSLSIPDQIAGTDGRRALRQGAQFTVAATGSGTGLFLPNTGPSLAAYKSPSGFAVGDLDLDGDLDVVVSSGKVRFNNGEGAFPDSTNHALFVNTPPRAVSVVDIDADGDGDLLFSNGHVFINNGKAAFTRQLPVPPLAEELSDLAVGDLDSDGDLDLAAVSAARDSVSIRLNDGSGRFPIQLQVAVGSRPVGIQLGDIDNDGDLDLITANEGTAASGSLSIGFNNGIGWFSNVRTLAAGSALSRFVLGDLDGDQDLDLVTNTGLVRFNDGAGAFSGNQTTPAGQGLAVADIDADGDLDLVVAGGENTLVRRNNGAGQFSGSETLFLGTGGKGHTPILADLDGDGDVDLLTANTTTKAVHIALNQRLVAPSAIRFSPANGLPGALVIITGTDLIGTTRVTFNGTEAPNYTVVTASRLEVRVPVGASSGLVQVNNSQGATSSTSAFTVLSPVSVLSVSPAPYANAPSNTAVTVSLGQPMASNTAATLAVFSQKRGGLLSGTRTGAGTATIAFAPTRAFEPGERISVSIPATTLVTQSRVVKRVYQFTAAVAGTGRGFFGTYTPIAGGGRHTLFGDVDNDGDQDVLQLHDQQVMLRLNTGTGNFGSDATVLTSQASTLGTMALGDVDGDGDLDLAVTNLTNDLVQIGLNDGRGAFVTAPAVPVDDYPQLLALADFDGDGDLDLLTANSGSVATSTSLRLNDGTGKFSGSTNEVLYPEGGNALGVLKVGDLDGDGDLDLVISYSISNYVRLNDGHGHFTFASRLPFSQDIGSAAIELADVDSDGDLDALALTWRDPWGYVSSGAWVNVNLNDGKASFSPGGFTAGRGMDGIAVGDVDADGDQDLVLTSANFSTGEVWVNNGQASFASLVNLSVPDKQIRPVLSDVDSDGDLDLIHTYPHLSQQLNSPAPTLAISGFSPSAAPVGTTVQLTGSGFVNVSAITFNGVLAPEFSVQSPTQTTVKVPPGASTGFISVTAAAGVATSTMAFTVQSQESTSVLTPGPNALAVAREAPIRLTFSASVTEATASSLRVFGNQLQGQRLGKISGGGTATLTFDPTQDFAPGEQVSVSVPATVLTSNGGVVRKQVYQFTAATGGTGRGFFHAGSSFPTDNFPYALAMGDLDNDGDLDLLNSSQIVNTYGVSVQLNDGTAHFTSGPRLTTGGSSAVKYVKLGDIDGDGDLDILATTESQQGLVFFNRGNATFTAAEKLPMPSMYLELGDLDGDGDLDVLTTGNAALTVALNNGKGQFSPLLPGITTLTTRMVALGDVDADGDLDALAANGAESVVLYRNNGNGIFEYSNTIPRTLTAHNLALGDLDADGDLDIAVGYNENVIDGWLTTLVNDGSGRFTATGQRVSVGRLVYQVLLGDVDHDNDLDLVTMNANSYTIDVQLNNGAGAFSGNHSMMTPSSPSFMALGDLDGDGDLDFAVTHGISSAPVVAIGINEARPVLSATPSAAAQQVILYPNPAHEQFMLRVPLELRSSASSASTLRLYNAMGQLVVEEALRLSAGGEQVVSVSQLPAGVYTVRIPLKGQEASYKLVIY